MDNPSPKIFLINYLFQGLHTPILPIGLAQFRNFLSQIGLPVFTLQFSLWKESFRFNRQVDVSQGNALPDMSRQEISNLINEYYEGIKKDLSSCDVLVFSGSPQVAWPHDLKLYAQALKYLLDTVLKYHKQLPVFLGGGLVNSLQLFATFPYYEVSYHNQFFFHSNRQLFIDFLWERFGFENRDIQSSVYQQFPDYTLFPEYDNKYFSDYTFNHKRLQNYLPESQVPSDLNELTEVTPVPYIFSQGCPNRCAFCEHSSKTCRYLSVGQIIDDLLRLRENHPLQEVYFLNSQFMYAKKFGLELCKRMIDEKLDILWSDSVDLSVIDEEIASLMAEAGCICLWVGLESPNDRMLAYINKKITTRQASQGIETLHKAGIWIGCNLILGMPYERDQDVNNTCSFIAEHKQQINAWQLNRFAVRPGSEFFNKPEKYGINIFVNQESARPPYCHDEINGISWTERREKTNIAYNKIFNNYIDYGNTWVNSDAYLIFSLYRSLKDKSKVQDWLDKNRSMLSYYLPFGDKIPKPR